jgi:hypothetical protein
MKGIEKMLVFTHIKGFFSICFAIVCFLGLPFAAKAQTAASKGNTHVIDKSKLAIHQNFRDEQPQRFNNNRSKIEEGSKSSNVRSKTSSAKNTSVHTKGTGPATTAVAGKNANATITTHKARVKHHKLARKERH